MLPGNLHVRQGNSAGPAVEAEDAVAPEIGGENVFPVRGEGGAMHMGRRAVFLISKYLREAVDAALVIQAEGRQGPATIVGADEGVAGAEKVAGILAADDGFGKGDLPEEGQRVHPGRGPGRIGADPVGADALAPVAVFVDRIGLGAIRRRDDERRIAGGRDGQQAGRSGLSVKGIQIDAFGRRAFRIGPNQNAQVLCLDGQAEKQQGEWQGEVFHKVKDKIIARKMIARWCLARWAVFVGPGHQNGWFWGTTGGFRRSGTPKWLVLGHDGRFSRARDTKKAGFGARQAVFASSGHQNGWFWGTTGGFCGSRMGKSASFAQRGADVQAV